MKNTSLTLYIEIDNNNLIFFVCESDIQNYFNQTFKLKVKLDDLENDKISDFNKIYNVIKKNIYSIEQKLNFTFKEVVLILENFDPSFISFTGYKKLNGSQVLKENITYILNSLKSRIDELENKKKILHIFNSKFNLDNKIIENLPIGLFGDLYCHELSFTLINLNDFKNLNNIFQQCNLNIKKVLLKSFICGALISNNNPGINSFFQIKICNKNSKIFYFGNDSLKFEQDFKFGIEIIIKDISKITSLKIETVKEILKKIEYKKAFLDDELIESKFFEDGHYRKIKKKLINDISKARVKEICDLLIFNNKNFKYFSETSQIIYLKINDTVYSKYLKNIFEDVLSINNKFKIKILENSSSENMMKTADKLVHFGWKKEAIAVTQSKKSLIVRLFDAIFG